MKLTIPYYYGLNKFSILRRNSTWDPDPFKINKLNDCNLTKEDYVDSNKWVGLGDDTCTDPQILTLKDAGGGQSVPMGF